MLLTREKIDSSTFRFITQKKSLDERFSLCIAGKKKFKCDEEVQDASRLTKILQFTC